MASRKGWRLTDISAAPAAIRCFASISLARWSSRSCATAMGILPGLADSTEIGSGTLSRSKNVLQILEAGRKSRTLPMLFVGLKHMGNVKFTEWKHP